ncbi:MAG: hypothetical protein AAB074_14400 [Planctomycetota bacterium]
MKRRLTTILALAAFFAGHTVVTACQASMSVMATRKARPAGFCCSKKTPPVPKAPESKSCCCSDGANLAVVDESDPVVAAANGVATDDGVPILLALAAPAIDAGRAPPGRVPTVPLYTLYATLLI